MKRHYRTLKSFIVFASFALTHYPAHAGSLELSDFLLDQWNHVTDASRAQADDTDESGDWAMARFFMNVSPKITVGIREFSGLTVAPEIEFIWEKSELDPELDSKLKN